MGITSWYRRHRVAVDVAIAVGFAGLDTFLTLVHASWWSARPGTLAWALLALQALACLSLAFRRRFPFAVVAVLGGFSLLVSLLAWPVGVLDPVHGDTVWAPSATVLAAYGPVMSCRSRRAALVAVALLTLVVARPWQPSTMVLTVGVLRTAIGPLVALYFDARRRLVRATAAEARADERARLAGEMHDVVTHRVSLMVLQAGALKMTSQDDRVRGAAEELRQNGCQALDELRDLVGVLRATPDGDEPPSTAELATLAAESTAAGTPAELDCAGDPALASPVVGRTVYRVVREALTNARKHAPGAPVDVRVRYEPAGVRVTVSNAPPADTGDAGLAGTGSGLGLANLRSRVELVHGTMAAGPEPGGGFRVDVTLPAYVATVDPVG